MPVYDALLQLRQPWIEKLSWNLASEDGLREAFLEELNRFYNLLLQAVEWDDPAQLDPLLVEWAQARTETELREPDAASLPILSEMLIQTLQLAAERLPPEESLLVLQALLPLYTYAYERLSQEESRLRSAFTTSELEQAKQQLERMERNKSDFISVAAHELKTPLTLIQGYAAMLRETFPEADDSTNTLLEGIEHGTKRLEEIVDDMIDVSLIDNQALALNFQPTWLNRLFSVLREDLGALAEERGHKLKFRDFPGSDEMTHADSERLYQAFRNVLANAIKYTPDGGEIVVDGRLLSGFVEVTIRDSGIGVDPEFHEAIFEKFGRLGNPILHSSGKAKYKGGGPGLGLAISRGIFEAHGGTIWVQSEGFDETTLPGSVFHILLPLYEKPPGDELALMGQHILENLKAIDYMDGDPLP